MRLGDHALIERDGIECAGKSILHVFIEINAAGGVGAIVVAASGIGRRVISAVAVRGNAGRGAKVVIDLWWGY